MQAWNRRGMRAEGMEVVGGMEAGSGGLEGVYSTWYAGLDGVQACRAGKCTAILNRVAVFRECK
jgi:hypothetical protein